MTWKDHLTTAEGYLEIGLVAEANNEVDKMAPEDKARPEVYSLRLQIYALLGKWDYARICAEHLAKIWPERSAWRITWASCVRRTEGLAAAEKVLQNAVAIFPEDPSVLYHLACLAALSGEAERAKVLLALVFSRDDSLRAKALHDADLKSVWEEIEGME
jgi:tetratricopeptide (TPR) repeat protein